MALILAGVITIIGTQLKSTKKNFVALGIIQVIKANVVMIIHNPIQCQIHLFWTNETCKLYLTLKSGIILPQAYPICILPWTIMALIRLKLVNGSDFNICMSANPSSLYAHFKQYGISYCISYLHIYEQNDSTE